MMPPRPRLPQKFQPAPHGSLEKLAETKPSQIEIVSPESPRPPEMLSGVRIHGEVSALDTAIHEILISHAYEVDRKMESDRYSIDLKALTRFAGPHVRAVDVLKSIEKMRSITVDFGDSQDPNRRYKHVPMITMWEEIRRDKTAIGYAFPPPIRDLMKTMPSYAYIELTALADGPMSLKHSPALYKRLALEAAKVRWEPGKDNEVYVRFSPQELAAAVDFPGHEDGSFNTGKLADFAKKSLRDLESVRRFTVELEIVHEQGRGKPINGYCYTLRLSPPDFRHVRLNIDYKKQPTFRVGGPDDARFHCRSDLWKRAVKAFRRDDNEFASYDDNGLFRLWLVAVKEALDGKGMTPGYDSRSYRGDSLLAIVDDRGADYAAWGFLAEEVADPDLVDHLSDSSERYVATTEAEAARRKRLGWKTSTLEARAEKTRKHKRNQRTSEEIVQAYLKSKQEKQAAAKIEEDIVKSFPDFDTVKKPSSNVFHLRDNVDYDEEVMPIIAGREGDITRLLKFKGTADITVKVSASAAEWEGIEAALAELVEEGEMA